MEAMRVSTQELLTAVRKAMNRVDEILSPKAKCKRGATIFSCEFMIEPERLAIKVKRECAELFEGKYEEDDLTYIYTVKPKAVNFKKDESRYPDVGCLELSKLEKILSSSSSDEVVIYFEFPFTIAKIDDKTIYLTPGLTIETKAE
ncbi:MAG: hypothetical protein JHC31_05685 [Sulfurihydrogenibium sp.]|nr:hypothetical protein [Sulfurihydrogenibium sp.]